MTWRFGSSAAIVEAETYEPRSRRSVVTLSQAAHPAAEQYRVLRYRLECLAKRGHQGAGVHLAAVGRRQDHDGGQRGAGARQGRPQPRRPRRRRSAPPGRGHDAGAARHTKGLCDVVAGRASLDDCLWRFGADELYVLPAGNVPDDLSDDAVRPAPRRPDGDAQAALRLRASSTRRRCCRWPTCRRCAAISTARSWWCARTTRRRSWSTRRSTRSTACTVHGLVLNDVDPRVASMLRIAPVRRRRRRRFRPRGRQHVAFGPTSSRASSASSSASSCSCSARSW